MEIDRTSHSYLLGQTEYRLQTLKTETDQLRAALQKIIDEVENDDYLPEWADVVDKFDRLSNIARKALDIR